MILLYLDLLGTKAEWIRSGRPGVEAACKRFRERILKALAVEGPATAIGGGVESDSAALLFDDVDAALKVARRIYLGAFMLRPAAGQPREWLRGAVLTVADNALRSERPFAGKFSHLAYGVYSDGLLDAISTEKSGYRGMRLLIEDALVSRGLKERWRTAIGPLSFIPFRKLMYSGYPKRIQEAFQDFLWMGGADPADWSQLKMRMAARLRYAAPDPDEGAQAAATQVVFHECSAIRGHLSTRAKGRGRPRRP